MGRGVKDWLQKSGRTKTQIAQGSGLDLSVVSRLWNGLDTDPRYETIQKLASFLGQPAFDHNRNDLVDNLVDRFSSLASISQVRKALGLVKFSKDDRRLLEEVWTKLDEFSSNARDRARVFISSMILKDVSTRSQAQEGLIRIATYHAYRFLSDSPSKDMKDLNRLFESSPLLVRARIIGEAQNTMVSESDALDRINSHIYSIEEAESRRRDELTEVHCQDHETYYGTLFAAADNLLNQFANLDKRKYAPLAAYIPWVLRQMTLRNDGLIFRLYQDAGAKAKLRTLLQCEHSSKEVLNEIKRLEQVIRAALRKHPRAVERDLFR
ncbi:MAG TPA: helix-turn-helix transcriptional regulator [Terriglobia bacterium]|nr:helix-turn-helix transcriptional regulator [Terriglobia bacterium]